jgi:hypothetical protein
LMRPVAVDLCLAEFASAIDHAISMGCLSPARSLVAGHDGELSRSLLRAAAEDVTNQEQKGN